MSTYGTLPSEKSPEPSVELAFRAKGRNGALGYHSASTDIDGLTTESAAASAGPLR